MRVNFYILSRFIISRKKSLNAFFFVFLSSLLWGQSPFVDNAPGSRSWTAPAGVTSITVEVWGAGGGGQGVGVNGTSQSGGGGAGGGYVKTTYSVTPGNTYNYKVGSGGSGGETNKDGEDSWFNSNITVLAVGGKGAGLNTILGNGGGAISIKSGNIGGALISTYGGNGADGTNGISGGGGSSAGDTNGNNASGGTGGSAPNNGFSGAYGLTDNPSPGVVGNIGAGGSGAKKGNGGAHPTGGNGGSGQIRITYTAVCTGAPSGGTASLSAITGAPSSTFTASVTGSVTGSAYTYQWQSAPSSTGPWTDIAGATSSGSTTITAVSTVSTTYYRRRVTCTNSGEVDYSSTVSYTTVLTYCKPTSSNPSSLYIREFQFVGVLNNPPAKTSTYSTGYEDWTSFTPIAQQPQNTAMNITAKTNGTSGGSWMAWVDWNRDGDFDDAGEEIYRMTEWRTTSITFGFIVPSSALGVYRLRIGTSSTSKSDGTYSFTSCTKLEGEYEDYLFEAVVDCPAKVLTINDVYAFDGERCGPGSVRLSAKGTASAVSFNWYDYDENNKIYTYLGTGITYNTSSISSTKTYYVKAITNTDSSAANYCETPFFYPVEARIDPNPTVTFSTSDPAICGEDKPSILVSASGDKYQDVIFEKFDSGLGQFKGNITDTESVYIDQNAEWINRQSPYIPTVPPYEGLTPAMSSGYFGGNFAMINSDIDRSTNIKYQLISNNSTNPNKLLNVNGYLNLQLDFDLYHFSIAKNNKQGYVEVSYTLDASVSNPVWVSLALPGYTVADASGAYPNRYWVDMGNPLNWKHFSITIPGSNFTSDKFAIRFIHFSSGDIGAGQKFYEAITTVDNVRLYGYKNITTPFAWSSATTTLYKPDCVTALGSALESKVCVKPSATELEDLNWTLNANANFSNGCPAIGSFVVNNDTKTWRQTGITDWNLGAQWRPSTVPTIAKCVIVRTPVELPSLTTGTHGLAKSVIVKPGGKLTIDPRSSLTIQNYLKNEAAASDVLVESDANLIQNNNDAINIGNITVKRSANLKRLDYNYWGAPVTGQNVKAFSPGTLDTRFYVYNESNDYFDGLFIRNLYPDNVTYSLTPTVDKNTYTFIKGKGYGIRASNALSSTTSAQMHSFIGVPNNGIVDIALLKSATGGGYNLISNPYPSNIDFYKIFEYTYNGGVNKNEDLIYNTAYFWTNTNFNPKMQGTNYPSNVGTTTIINNYAVLNGTGGLGAPYGFAVDKAPVSIVPTSVIKPGQGFIVKAKTNGNLRIENGFNIRTNDANSTFFNRMASHRTAADIKDRFWVSLKTPLDFVTPLLIGYLKGATNNFEEDYDAELFVHGGDSFYTILEDKKLAIQGRSPFNVNDKISLGATFGLQGQYEIFIENKEGVFASQQPIYLKDNLTGQITNLSQDKYVFTANVGDTTNRFEIQYTNEGTLNTSDLKNQSTVVYQVQNDIIIESASVIKGLKVYDASGKLVHQSIEKEKKVTVSSIHYSKGVYVIEIVTERGKEVKKIVK